MNQRFGASRNPKARHLGLQLVLGGCVLLAGLRLAGVHLTGLEPVLALGVIWMLLGAGLIIASPRSGLVRMVAVALALLALPAWVVFFVLVSSSVFQQSEGRFSSLFQGMTLWSGAAGIVLLAIGWSLWRSTLGAQKGKPRPQVVNRRAR